MPVSQPNLFTRHDTFFGVCEAIGQDFGFHSNYLRLAVGVGLLLNPIVTLAVYAAVGVVVAASRWIFPTRRAVTVQSVELAPRIGDNDEGAIAYAKAA